MKEIIKRLEEEKNQIELRLIRLNRIISDLKELNSEKVLVKPIGKPKGKLIVTKCNKKQKTNGVKKGGRYPEEMQGFVERHMNQNSNKNLCKLVEERFELKITPPQIANYMFVRNLKRENPNRQRTQQKKQPEKLKGWAKYHADKKKKKYPDKLKINGVEVPQDVIQYARSRGDVDPLQLRDEIIEMFNVNYRIAEIKIMQGRPVREKKIIDEEFEDAL